MCMCCCCPDAPVPAEEIVNGCAFLCCPCISLCVLITAPYYFIIWVGKGYLWLVNRLCYSIM